MGNLNKQIHEYEILKIPSEFVSNLQYIATYQYSIVYRHRNTKQQYEQYKIVINHQSFEQYLQIYEFRNYQNMYLVKVKYIQKISQKYLCVGNYHLNVYTEHIQILLKDIINVPFIYSLYLIMSSLIGFKAIFHRYGYIKIIESLIGINKQGKCKVWMNQNFGSNNPKNALSNVDNDQYQMVRTIFELIQKHSNEEQHIFEKFKNVRKEIKKLDFDNGCAFIENFCKLNKIILPNKFDLIQNYCKEKIYSLKHYVHKKNKISQISIPVHNNTKQIMKPLPIKQKLSLHKNISDTRVKINTINKNDSMIIANNNYIKPQVNLNLLKHQNNNKINYNKNINLRNVSFNYHRNPSQIQKIKIQSPILNKSIVYPQKYKINNSEFDKSSLISPITYFQNDKIIQNIIPQHKQSIANDFKVSKTAFQQWLEKEKDKITKNKIKENLIVSNNIYQNVHNNPQELNIYPSRVSEYFNNDKVQNTQFIKKQQNNQQMIMKPLQVPLQFPQDYNQQDFFLQNQLDYHKYQNLLKENNSTSLKQSITFQELGNSNPTPKHIDNVYLPKLQQLTKGRDISWSMSPDDGYQAILNQLKAQNELKNQNIY